MSRDAYWTLSCWGLVGRGVGLMWGPTSAYMMVWDSVCVCVRVSECMRESVCVCCVCGMCGMFEREMGGCCRFVFKICVCSVCVCTNQ